MPSGTFNLYKKILIEESGKIVARISRPYSDFNTLAAVTRIRRLVRGVFRKQAEVARWKFQFSTRNVVTCAKCALNRTHVVCSGDSIITLFSIAYCPFACATTFLHTRFRLRELSRDFPRTSSSPAPGRGPAFLRGNLRVTLERECTIRRKGP